MRGRFVDSIRVVGDTWLRSCGQKVLV